MDEIVLELMEKGYSKEQILAIINYQLEFPYDEKEHEKEFIEFINMKYDGLVDKIQKEYESEAYTLMLKRVLPSVFLKAENP